VGRLIPNAWANPLFDGPAAAPSTTRALSTTRGGVWRPCTNAGNHSRSPGLTRNGRAGFHIVRPLSHDQCSL